jgi:hypothetical protein
MYSLLGTTEADPPCTGTVHIEQQQVSAHKLHTFQLPCSKWQAQLFELQIDTNNPVNHNCLYQLAFCDYLCT